MRINILIPDDLHKAVRAIKKARGLTLTRIIVDALVMYVRANRRHLPGGEA